MSVYLSCLAHQNRSQHPSRGLFVSSPYCLWIVIRHFHYFTLVYHTFIFSSFQPSAFSLGDLCVPPMANVLKVFLENGQTKSFKYDTTTTVAVSNSISSFCFSSFFFL